MDKSRTGVCDVLLATVLFGAMPLMARYAGQGGAGTLEISFSRFFFGTLLCYPLLKMKRIKCRMPSATLKWLVLAGVMQGMTTLFLFSSYNYIDTGLATTIHFSYPVMVALGSHLFFGSVMNRKSRFCLLLCSAGILLLYTPSGDVNLTGMGVAFLSGLTFALYILILRRSGSGAYPVLVVNFWVALFAAGFLFPFAVSEGMLVNPVTGRGWFFLILLGFSATVAAQTLFQKAIFLIGEVRTSLLGTFEPLTSVVIGMVLFHESLTFRVSAGMALILLSTMLIALAKESPRRVCGCSGQGR